jgi:hypothetical protein
MTQAADTAGNTRRACGLAVAVIVPDFLMDEA